MSGICIQQHNASNVFIQRLQAFIFLFLVLFIYFLTFFVLFVRFPHLW